MKRRLWIGLSLAIFIGIFSSSVSAQLGGNLTINDSETSNVTVILSTVTMVDINPAAFTWQGVDPGSVGDDTEETNNFYAIQVENIGSHNITHVWFNATYPTSSPFAVGSTANTNSGNYVVLANATQNGSIINNRTKFEETFNLSYRFINRVEYNETRPLVYLTDPDGNMPPNNTKYLYGRFRNASNEYFWMLRIDDGSCEDNEFYIGDEAHTKWTTGSVNFANPGCVAGLTNSPGTGIGACRVGTLTNNSVLSGAGATSRYGYANILIGTEKYCVVVVNCTRVFFSHWNRDFPFNLCTSPYARYAWDSSLDGPLTPGDSFVMGIKVRVPFGIYEGNSNQGYITAIVNDV